MEANTNTQAPATSEVKEAPTKGKASKKAPTKAKASKKAKGKGKKADAGSTAKGPQVLRQYAPKYHKDTEKKTAGGHVSIDNDDRVAKVLRGATLDEVYERAAKVLQDKDGKPFTVKALKAKYAHLNSGMQRMNLGNRMRAA